MAVKMTSLECPKCTANIELDSSKNFGFCPYCGSKVLIQSKYIDEIKKMELEQAEKIRNDKFMLKLCLGFGIFYILMTLILVLSGS